MYGFVHNHPELDRIWIVQTQTCFHFKDLFEDVHLLHDNYANIYCIYIYMYINGLYIYIYTKPNMGAQDR